ncbi:MAG: hypothetical protein ACOC95_02505 [Planctomycetota bacterium]
MGQQDVPPVGGAIVVGGCARPRRVVELHHRIERIVVRRARRGRPDDQFVPGVGAEPLDVEVGPVVDGVEMTD